MTKLVLDNVASGYASVSKLNNNFDKIEIAIENTLSRDGTSPNQMSANLDMNGHLILNQANPIAISGLTWEGPWVTGQSYSIGDIVENNGTAYMAIVAHTSGVFTTDFVAAKWQLFATASLPSQTANANRFLQTDGATTSWQIPDATEVSFTQAGTGAVLRTEQSKLQDQVSAFDFMTTAQIADVKARTALVDVTAALKAAADSLGVKGGTVVCPSGKYRIQTELAVTNRANFRGQGRSTTFVLTDATSKFSIKGTSAVKLENNVISDLEFEGNSTVSFGGTPQSAALIVLDWVNYLKFENCLFYHTNIDADHMAFWSIDHCEFFDLNINNRFTRALGEANEKSSAPKISNSFMSVTLLYLEDSEDLLLVNSHWFGGDYAIKVRLVNFVPDVGTEAALPFFISNTLFDSISGTAIDAYNASRSTITGCWFSAGRGYGVTGISFYASHQLTLTNNQVVFCGATNLIAAGMTLDNCDQVSIIGGNYSTNYSYGIRMVSCNQVSIVGADFTNTPTIFGGGYTQMDGIVDVGGLSTNMTVIGCRFDASFTNKIYAPDASNTFLNNSNFDENIVKGTKLRSTVDLSMQLGTEFFKFTNVHTQAIKFNAVTVASLPAAASSVGQRQIVTNATATTFASIVAGGGANIVPVYCDGTNWRIG